jgi:hypothetical protein
MNTPAAYMVPIDRRRREYPSGYEVRFSRVAIVFDPIDGSPTMNVPAAGRSLGDKRKRAVARFFCARFASSISLVANAID